MSDRDIGYGFTLDYDGRFNGGRCVLSIGSWVRSRCGHYGYVRVIDYEKRLAWVSDGDGSREFSFGELFVP